jgi:hypothetical protein
MILQKQVYLAKLGKVTTKVVLEFIANSLGGRVKSTIEYFLMNLYPFVAMNIKLAHTCWKLHLK